MPTCESSHPVGFTELDFGITILLAADALLLHLKTEFTVFNLIPTSLPRVPSLPTHFGTDVIIIVLDAVIFQQKISKKISISTKFANYACTATNTTNTGTTFG
jgi:hypothetical protein